MLAQKNRFHGHASLKYVYRNGTVSRSRLFMVRAIVNQRRTTHRCSVVVSKKVLKSAVGRNQIRRRVYHSIHAQLESLNDGPWDIVIGVCSAEVGVLPYHEVEAALQAQLREVGALAPPQ